MRPIARVPPQSPDIPIFPQFLMTDGPKKVFKIRQRFQQVRFISQVTHDASGPGSECPPKVSAVFVFGATFREKSDFFFFKSFAR